MNVVRLFRWQWEGYARYHRSRANLLLHIVVVPLFLAGNVMLVVSLVQGWWIAALLSVAAMVASIALQGRGHGQEAEPPVLFSSPGNAVGRIFLEQWVTFPLYVLSGGWWRALRSA